MNEKKTINILLVEDEEGHAELITRSFETSKSGSYNLTIAKTVREARAFLAKNTPDLTIIDYKLPDGEGTELLQPKPSCPMIIMTGQGDEEMAVASLKAGALDYFVKSEKMFKDMPRIVERVLREWENIHKRKQAEEILLQNEKMLWQLSKAAFEGIVIAVKGEILKCNENFCSMFGYSLEELIGINVLKLVKPEFRDIVSENIAKGYEGVYEIVALKKDATEFPIEVHGVLAPYQGRIARVTAIRDITERKRAEDALHNKTELLKLLQDIAIAANEAPTSEEAMRICLEIICSFVGWPIGHIYLTDSKRSLISSKIWCVENKKRFKDFRKITEATSFDKGIGLPGRVLESGKPIWIADVTKEPWFLRTKSAKDVGIKAGFAFPVLERKKITAVLEFFSGEAIEPDEFLLEALSNFGLQIGRVTERKRSEDELHRLGKAIEQADEVIMITDIDSSIQYVNPSFEKITGYKKDEVIGKNPRILQSSKQDKLFYNKMWDTLKEGQVWSGHFINKKKDGTLFEEDATISPVFDNSDNIINYVAVKRDVTKEVMLESQLRQSQKLEAVGTLAGGIAHDFNNILTGIIGYTEISIDSLPEDSEISNYLNQVLKSSYRARDLVKQILTFSRQIETELKPLELGSVVKEVLKLIKASLPSTIKICSNIDKATGIVVADLTQMHQLIMNLCVNAEHAMREKGGILEINLDPVNVDADLASIHTNLKEGLYIKLTVRDTGHGMDKKTAERVFDPFFTTKKAGEGTGLGLTTVHGIVLSHKGEITINSKPGKGTTFEVYLPRADTISIKQNLKRQPMPGGNERILLVDDEKTILDVWQEVLEKLGYEVVIKNSSLEAFETFKADPKRFDIVITDQTMPDMTGVELARELMRIQHDIPVILCTGFSHSITKEKAEAIGIKKFIMKPLVIRDMAVAIREVLEKEK